MPRPTDDLLNGVPRVILFLYHSQGQDMDENKQETIEVAERWDALDHEGRLLGFDLIRGRTIPSGVFHAIAEIYTVTPERKVLVTRRGNKTLWPYCWEITTGAVVKGETPEAGACRELEEETGLLVEQARLIPVYQILHRHEIYYGYLYFTDLTHPSVRLQAGETTDYRFLPYPEFKAFVKSDFFAAPLRERFLAHQEHFDRVIQDTD